MIVHVTKLASDGSVIIAEQYDDEAQKIDPDPETGKVRKRLFTGQERAEARANALSSQLEEGEKVIVSETAYVPPEV
jgi:hypothetical protein